jgi:hypothetical protein
MAARVADQVGVDVDKTAMKRQVPALGRRTNAIMLRNWSGKARAWKAAASDKWIVPAQVEGALLGFQELKFDLDGATLTPGTNVEGTLTVTDVASGRRLAVKITAGVTSPLELTYDHPHFNIQVGGSDTRKFRVSNRAVGLQDWKLISPVSWLKIEPSSGQLRPGQDLYVTLTSAPPDKEAAVEEINLVFQGAGGKVDQTVLSKTFVIPMLREKEDRRMPFGKIAQIENMNSRLKSCVLCAKGTIIETGVAREHGAAHTRTLKTAPCGERWGVAGGAANADGLLLLIGKERFSRGMWVYPHHESVYDLGGANIAAFSSYVGIANDARNNVIVNSHRQVNFEVYVDGKLRAQSGLMSTIDPPRYLVVEGIEGAKELKLVTRLDSEQDDPTFLATWADTNFYKKE